MEGTMAVITPVAYDFTPKYWGQCNGQVLSIAQNTALFSLLGTTYGGNGVTTFALPDLRGRVAVGVGQLAGGSNYSLGEVTGTESTVLTINTMPAHAHNGNIGMTPRAGNSADDPAPTDEYPGQIPNGFASTPTASSFMQGPTIVSTVIGTAGGGQPFEILTPYLVVNFVICMYGIFPSRN